MPSETGVVRLCAARPSVSARPVDSRLFFAGEASINGAQGTCHGAYLSGIRAAQEIAAQLNAGSWSKGVPSPLSSDY